ncbi:MAG: YbhB/YbcL family Raf kinase inhibitor-like protein [Terracidiphilus sp.]
MKLTASSFRQGWIPGRFTCDGEDLSPPLAWTDPPAGTQSFALIVTDPDAPGGTFVHWVLYDLPAEARSLPEAVPGKGRLANGAAQGRNNFGKLGYGGPCPPGKSPHHYIFTLYALNVRLNLPPGATPSQIEQAMEGHILASDTLTGLFHR